MVSQDFSFKYQSSEYLAGTHIGVKRLFWTQILLWFNKEELVKTI